ncbi:MAG: N-acetyltransferase [Proteobacteria bacterium]|nr:N-acetyltransferase [Pseudomonadota bacterium]
MWSKLNLMKEIMGIMMICIDPKYRGKGLGKKLITKHFEEDNHIIRSFKNIFWIKYFSFSRICFIL